MFSVSWMCDVGFPHLVPPTFDIQFTDVVDDEKDIWHFLTNWVVLSSACAQSIDRNSTRNRQASEHPGQSLPGGRTLDRARTE